MTKFKVQNKSFNSGNSTPKEKGTFLFLTFPNQKKNRNVPFILGFVICALSLFWILCFDICHSAFAQETDLEFSLDAASNTITLPKIFKPNIDLSGRGYHRDAAWPQNLAAKETIERWQNDIGFNGIYRMQYSLWEITQLSKDKEAQDKLLGNYEDIMKDITDAGGIVILDVFGTPAGLGQVLDKKSPARDLKAFKEFIKGYIRQLSCNKKYNIWYELWDAPDLDDFFLGRKQDYLNMYRALAESVEELEAETKIHIPIGGPSVSWWFQNLDGNTIATPEKSLAYELIKFCSHYHLRLDFISWHAFSTDVAAEKEISLYKKTAVELIRDWLSYFNLDRNTPLIVDEWNYDTNANIVPGRAEKSFICASYIPGRIKNMFESGIDYQIYFCLEDFQNNKEGVVRNVGIFSFDPESSKYNAKAKATYTAFRMLGSLGAEMYLTKLDDPFVGVIATKTPEGLVFLIYNYIDPDIAMNYISKNIASLNPAERKRLINIIKAKKIEDILKGTSDISVLRLPNNVKNLLKKARDLDDKEKKFETTERNIKIQIKNLSTPIDKSSQQSTEPVSAETKQEYIYQRYVLDSGCSSDCEFSPFEQKDVFGLEVFEEKLTIKPYSLQMVLFKKKPQELEAPKTTEQPAANTAPIATAEPTAPAPAKSEETNAAKQ